MFGARGRAARPVRRGGVCQAPRVGGAAAKPTPRRAVRAGCVETGRVMSRWRRVGRKQWPRPRPREAHAAAHLRIVPVDAPSTLDQPPELRLIAVLCGLIHGLVHRVAHCARRALQAFARSDSCAFGGGTRGSAVTIGRRRRAHSVAVRMQLAHTPLGARGPRQPCWREGASRTLEATTARSRGCRTAWLPRPRAAWCGRAKQLAKQLAKQAIGRDQGIGIGRSPARGCAKLTFSIGIDFPVSPTLGALTVKRSVQKSVKCPEY